MEFLLTLYGAWAYRFRGTDGAPKFIRVALFTWPYFLFPYLTWLQFDFQGWENIAAVIAGLAGVIPAAYVTARGHGNNMDGGNNPQSPSGPEWYEKWLVWLKPKLSVSQYDYVALSFNGLLGTFLAGIACLNPFMALSGASKGFAYWLGWKYGGKTETGEVAFGAFSYSALGIGAMLLVF